MNSLDYVVDKVLKVIRRDIRKNTSDSYDTGTVKRIDGNIAWVQYDEKNPQVTPVVISGASCKKGDKVRIKNNNGTAFILGNDSNPPTDDTKAEHAQVTAEAADKTAKDAQIKASEALEDTEHIAQYFWHKDGTDSEAGAHVTEVPAEEFMQNPSGGNILMRSNSIKLRMALITLAELTGTALFFYDPNTGQERLRLFEDGLDLIGKKFGGSETNRNYSFARLRSQSFAIGYHSADNNEEIISESFGHSGFSNRMYSRKTVYNSIDLLKYFISYILDDAGFRIVRDRSTSPYNTGSTSRHWEISELTEDGLHLGGVENYAYTDITPAEEERYSATGMGDVKDIFRAVSTDNDTLFLIGEVSEDFTDDTKTNTVEVGMKIDDSASTGSIDKQLYDIIATLGWNTQVAGVIADDIRP